MLGGTLVGHVSASPAVWDMTCFMLDDNSF